MALILFSGAPQRLPSGCLLTDEPAARPQDGPRRLRGRGAREDGRGGIDAAIVDIPLPDEGAPEMVRDLHDANPSIPVLVMTALEDPAVHKQMLRAGAVEVLPKEVPFSEVLAAVRRLGY